MSSNSSLRRAVHHALVGSAALAAVYTSTVQAQDTDQPLEEVVITGTRIAQPQLESISPVTVISSEEIKLEGSTRVEDMLNSLPQVTADFGGDLSNGATGAATVSLRNLGAERTLVLINGRRLMPGDPQRNGEMAPDLNQIPAALLKRVDVLTGGASAVYGADAVAGVVNFIMTDDFEGIRVDANYSFYQHNQQNSYLQNELAANGFAAPHDDVRDGYAKDATVILGSNLADGRGNVTAYLGYRNLKAVRQNRRDFSSCSLGSGDQFGCQGSASSATGTFFGNDFVPTDPNDPTDVSPGFGYGGTYTVGAGGIEEWSESGLYNFAPLNYFQRPDERYTAGIFGHLDLNDHATAYTEFMFMDDRTISQVAPSGAFLGSGIATDPVTGGVTGNWYVNCDNPYLIAAGGVEEFCPSGSYTTTDPATGQAVQVPYVNADNLTQVTFGRRNVEGGPRREDLRHTSYRGVLGVRGDLAGSWKYDAYGLFGRTVFVSNFQNDVSKSRLQNALLAVVDPSTGEIVCKANANGANGAPGCVPYNIWQPGGVTQEAVDYFTIPGLQQGETTEQIVSASVTGDLGDYGVKLPSANGGLAVAFGAEYRRESTELIPDNAYITNDLAGQGAPTLPYEASLDVKEIFTELRLPIANNLPAIQSLSAEAGYRYSDYNLGFSTNTYKLGVDWAPVRTARVRSSYQRAVRAPNLQELYLPGRVELNGTTDPCAGETPDATFEQCARTGVTAAQYGRIANNPAEQYNAYSVGNADLKPETADTYSFGVVFTPLQDLAVTIDYFNIKIEDVIDTIGVDYTLNQCLTTGSAFYCDLINRSSNGSLWLSESGFTQDPYRNLGSQKTSGIDLNADYRLDIGRLGRLAFNLTGTYTIDFKTVPVPGDIEYDCVGLYGTICQVPLPEWRHKLRTTWGTPIDGLSLSLSWRHVDAVDLDHTSSNPTLAGEVDETDRTLGSREYFDLTGSYAFMERATVRLGVNNIFDKDPPLVGQSNAVSVYVSGNTFPQVYDTLGRYIFMNMTLDF